MAAGSAVLDPEHFTHHHVCPLYTNLGSCHTNSCAENSCAESKSQWELILFPPGYQFQVFLVLLSKMQVLNLVKLGLKPDLPVFGNRCWPIPKVTRSWVSSLHLFPSHCRITWDSLHSHDNLECVFISTKPLLRGDKSNIKEGKVPTYPPATSPLKNGSGNRGRCLLWKKDALCDPSAICGTETW